MKPQGAANMIGAAFARIAKWDDLPTLDAYVQSETFIKLFMLVEPKVRVTLMRSYQQARVKCLLRKPIAAPRSVRVRWDGPMIQRFRAAWVQHSGNKHRVARALGITEAAADRAYFRFVAADATVNQQKVA